MTVLFSSTGSSLILLMVILKINSNPIELDVMWVSFEVTHEEDYWRIYTSPEMHIVEMRSLC